LTAEGPRAAFDELKGKIALVKQEVYQDLYCCAPGSSQPDVLASTLFRSGPVALFTELRADFFVVKLESDPECQVWKDKVFDCKQGTEQSYLALRSEVFRNGEYGHEKPQGHFAVSCDRVDWSKYSIVISYDIAIPARVTRQYPQVTWCYYIGEPCMRTYKSSLEKPVQGYDLFLNQRYRRIRLLPKPARHVVEFPYFLQNHGCFHRVLDMNDDPAHRSGVFVEGRSKSELNETDLKSLSKFGPVRWPAGNVMNVLSGLMDSKYFVIPAGRKWGNAMIEAIAAGCLAVGTPDQQHNVSLFTPGTRCGSFKDIVARLELFERDRKAFDRELVRQRHLLDWFCFARPLRDLVRRIRQVQEDRIWQTGSKP